MFNGVITMQRLASTLVASACVGAQVAGLGSAPVTNDAALVLSFAVILLAAGSLVLFHYRDGVFAEYGTLALCAALPLALIVALPAAAGSWTVASVAAFGLLLAVFDHFIAVPAGEDDDRAFEEALAIANGRARLPAQLSGDQSPRS